MNGWFKNLEEVLLLFKSIIFNFIQKEENVQDIGFKTEFEFFSVSKDLFKEINKREGFVNTT